MASHERQSAPRYGAVLAIVAGIPVLYVLSLGPAVWLLFREHISIHTFDFIYAPLAWLGERSDAFHNFFLWYREFWIPDP